MCWYKLIFYVEFFIGYRDVNGWNIVFEIILSVIRDVEGIRGSVDFEKI